MSEFDEAMEYLFLAAGEQLTDRRDWYLLDPVEPVESEVKHIIMEQDD